MMITGLIFLAYSLQFVNQTLCILSICLVTPLAATMMYHQSFVAVWSLKSQVYDEKIKWLLEFVSLTTVITCLYLLDMWQT